MTRPLAEVCREAEECLKNWDDPRHDFAAPGYVALRHSDAVDCVLALRALRALAAAESRAERLAEALREIAVGLIAEDKLHGNKFEGSLCAARLVGIARAAISRPGAGKEGERG